MTEDTHYQVLKILERSLPIPQRELAGEMHVSLGKANYCLKVLVEKGLVRAKNIKNSANKIAYSYVLTPRGIEAKAKVTVFILQRELGEHEVLRMQIEELQVEVNGELAQRGDLGSRLGKL